MTLIPPSKGGPLESVIDICKTKNRFGLCSFFFPFLFKVLEYQSLDDFIGIGLLSYCLQFQSFNHFFINCGSEFLANIQRLLSLHTYIRIFYPSDLILAI